MKKGLFLGLLLLLTGCQVERSYDGRSMTAWRKDLKSRDPMARWRALTILTQVGDEELRKALPDVMNLLDDGEVLVRTQATRAITRLGPDGKPAVPQLVKMLRDPEPSVREWAGKALKAVDQEAAERAGID